MGHVGLWLEVAVLQGYSSRYVSFEVGRGICSRRGFGFCLVPQMLVSQEQLRVAGLAADEAHNAPSSYVYYFVQTYSTTSGLPRGTSEVLLSWAHSSPLLGDRCEIIQHDTVQYIKYGTFYMKYIIL